MSNVQVVAWSELRRWAPPGRGVGAGEWELAPLRDVLTPLTPAAYTPTENEIVRFAGVRWYGNGIYVREERIPAEIKSKCYPLVPGALVYNRLFGWKSAFDIVAEDFVGVVVSNEFPQFAVDEAKAIPEFVKLVCGSPAFAAVMLAQSTGSTAVSRNRLHVDDLLDLDIPLPGRDIQAAIVEEYNTRQAEADRLVATAQARRTRAAAAFSAALGVPPTPDLPAAPMVSVAHFSLLARWDAEAADGPVVLHYPVSRLNEKATVRLGCQIPKKDANPAGVERPYLRAANVQRGHLRLESVKTMRVSPSQAATLALEEDDLLFLEGSGSVSEVGRCAVWGNELPDVIHQNSVIRARIHDHEELNPRFAAAWFNSEAGSAYFKDQATTTSGLFHIGAGKTGRAPVPVPPGDVQRELASAYWSEANAAAEAEATAIALSADTVRWFARRAFGEEAELVEHELDEAPVEDEEEAEQLESSTPE